jgi:hypothetical protein
VVADEPTANLDSTTATQIIDLMHEAVEQDGASFLIATHDPAMAVRCTRIFASTTACSCPTGRQCPAGRRRPAARAVQGQGAQVMKALLYAIKNVQRNRRRSLITLAIAAVGTAAVTIGGGFALYTYDSLREQAARDSGHVIIAAAGYFDHDEEKPMQYGLSDYQSLRNRLLLDERVRAVLPKVQTLGPDQQRRQIGSDDRQWRGPGRRVPRQGSVSQDHRRCDVLTPHPEPGSTPELLLGADLARSMNAHVDSGLTLMATTTEGTLNAIDVKVNGVISVGVPGDRQAPGPGRPYRLRSRCCSPTASVPWPCISKKRIRPRRWPQSWRAPAARSRSRPGRTRRSSTRPCVHCTTGSSDCWAPSSC